MQRLNSQFAKKFRTFRLRGRTPRPYSFNNEHVLGTSLELQVRARSERTATWAEREVLGEIDRLERILSGWSPESEFSRWLKTRGESLPVSAELIEVLRKADQWRTITGKAFDPAAQEVIEKLIQQGIGPPPAFEDKHAALWSVNSAASTA